ncbi:murein L,D-transpeptidase, partial [Citrobacter sp. AAK_AS5]
ARVEALRRRLLVTGELAAIGATPHVFDQEVVAAVKTFQERHSLEADGVVGKSVLAALNVPVESRIDQIRVNLERARWIFHEVPPTFLLVD